MQLPPVTRAYLLLCFVTTIGCYLDVRSRSSPCSPHSHVDDQPSTCVACDVRHEHVHVIYRALSRSTPHTVASDALPRVQLINPFQLFFSIPGLRKGEYWRIATCFLYLGELSTAPRTPASCTLPCACRLAERRRASPSLAEPRQLSLPLVTDAAACVQA